MALTVRDALQDTALAQTAPVVVAGHDGLDRTIRWVYTHERSDIAQFLSGGEFLIIEGSSLAAENSDLLYERYIRSLHAAGAAGLAIELLGPMAEVPSVMAAEADRLRFPVIGIRRRVLFVTISESLNTRIVHERIADASRLDKLSILLEEQMSTAEDLQQVTDAVVGALGPEVVYAALVDPSGTVTARSGSDDGAGEVLVKRLSVGATGVGTLLLRCSGNAVEEQPWYAHDEHLVRPVSMRVLRLQPLDERQRLVAELFGWDTDQLPRSVHEFGITYVLDRLGLDDRADVIGLCVRFRDPLNSLPAFHAEVLDRIGSRTAVLASYHGDRLRALLLPAAGDQASLVRRRCLALCEELASRHPVLIAVGGGGDLRTRLAEELYETSASVDLHGSRWGAAIDVRHDALHRFVDAISPGEPLRSFIDATVGPLLEADRRPLLEALVAYSRAMGNKSVAASELGVSRQTFYSRLAAAADLLGLDVEDQASMSLACIGARFSVERNVRSAAPQRDNEH